ncbi:MAG: hypothetical protein AAF317_20650, partial [Pseudomonadota bacterium]
MFWVTGPGAWIVLMMGLFLHTTWARNSVLTSLHLLRANGIAPVANAAEMRRNGPGILTTVLLFLPLAAASFV